MAKENQLKVFYRDGSTRVIQIDTEFFKSVALFDHKIGKMVEFTSREKALSIAESCGKEPFIVELLRDNQVLFKKTFEGNKPIKGRTWIGPKEKKGKKKDLRKAFKNKPFTVSMNWTQAKAIWKEQIEAEAA